MNSIEKELINRVYTYLLNNGITEKSTVIVGLSGGPDSTALILILSELTKLLNFQIKAAYVNHGIRAVFQLKKDDEFAVELTDQLNVELFSHKVKSGQIEITSSEEGRSSEEVARDLRYSFFEEILGKYENSFIALGHNLDDQFETMTIRFFHGSGIHGLKGIPHVNGKIIRPLIDTRKSEILSFLEQRNQRFQQDPTNSENNYLRNQVRNILIPQVEKIFPGYATSLVTLQSKFADMDQYFQMEADKIPCEYSESLSTVSLHDFNNSHKLIRLNLLFRMFDHAYNGNEKSLRVPEGFFNPLLLNRLKDNSTFAIAYGIKVFTVNNKLCFKAISHENTGFYYQFDKAEVQISGRYKFSKGMNKGLKLHVAVDSPLIIRSRMDGDYICINESRKTVKSIFSQWKVPDHLKSLIPILEDSSGIIALLGELQGFKNIFRNKKINSSEIFNILYLEVENIFQE